MAAFSLESGLRASNVTGLRWSAVDLERRLAWVHPDEAKARKAIPVPLNSEAMAIVKKQIGKHEEVVFTFRGEAVLQPSTAAWYEALKRAGIETFRWHLSLAHLGQLARAKRYTAACAAGAAADHLAPWADRFVEVRANRGTNQSQGGEDDRTYRHKEPVSR